MIYDLGYLAKATPTEMQPVLLLDLVSLMVVFLSFFWCFCHIILGIFLNWSTLQKYTLQTKVHPTDKSTPY